MHPAQDKGKEDMNRKLKVLGLAFLAVFAMSALTASAAQAQLQLTSTTGTWLSFSGSKATGGDAGLQTFTAGTVKVTCDSRQRSRGSCQQRNRNNSDRN